MAFKAVDVMLMLKQPGYLGRKVRGGHRRTSASVCHKTGLTFQIAGPDAFLL